MKQVIKPSDDSSSAVGEAIQGLRPCLSIEWYAKGQSRIVDIDSVQVTVRFVGRHGRRARIAITAPPGSAFRAAQTDMRRQEKSNLPPQLEIPSGGVPTTDS